MTPDALKIRLIPGDSSAVVCAPHGHDFWTAEVAQMVCSITGLCGVTVHHLEDHGDDLRVNVNRPTEGAGLRPDEEMPTLEAARAYARYLESVVEATRGRLDLYVEIHGNETQEHVEVATSGMGPELLAVKAALRGIPCGALVEGPDRVIKDGAAAKRFGIHRIMPRTLQFELPARARESEAARAMCAQSISAAIVAVLSVRTGPTLSRLFRAG